MQHSIADAGEPGSASLSQAVEPSSPNLSQAVVAPSTTGRVVAALEYDSFSEGSDGSEEEAYRTMEEYDRYLEYHMD